MIQATDPNLPWIDHPRVNRQSAVVLEALQTGPKTNTELAAITHRFGARVHDLRKAGYEIATIPLRDGTGRVTYRLIPWRGGSAKASEGASSTDSTPNTNERNQGQQQGLRGLP